MQIAPSVRPDLPRIQRITAQTVDQDHDAQAPAAELNELVAGLAHEVRNPLSTVMVNLKLLSEMLEDERTSAEVARRRAAEKVELLRKETARLQILFDNFLKLTGPAGLDRAEIDVNAVVARVAQFFEPQANSAGCRMQLGMHEGELVCSVDELLIRQALLNIMLNAVQAMSEGGTLTIETGCDHGSVNIRIADTGRGIPDAERARILKPFHSTKPRGSGLGLSITDRIVREHGGQLTFISRRGHGTTFTIRLPRHSGDGPLDA
jgi:signal transduction histidine kinase